MLSRRAFQASLLLSPSLSLCGQDWPQWRGPNRDGAAPPDPKTAEWPTRLSQLWKVTVGEGHSSPVVMDGRIFQFTRAADREVVAAYDLNSGRKLWQESYDAPYEMNPAATAHGKGPKSTPLVAAGKVYTFGMTGELSAWDAATGKLAWRYKSSSDWRRTSPGYGVAMSPILHGNNVIAHIGSEKNGALTAFDAQSGKVRWQWKGEGPAYSSPVLVTTAGLTELVTFSFEKLIGVNAADGTLSWEIRFTTPYAQNSVTPFVRGDTVIYSGLANPVTAIRIAGKATQKLWENSEVGMYMSSPVTAAGLIHGLSHRNKGQFFSLDPGSGKTVWLSDGRQGDNAMLVSRGDTVFALTTDSELFVMRASPSGLQRVRQYTVASSPVWAHPVILGRRILVKDRDSLALWSA